MPCMISSSKIYSSKFVKKVKEADNTYSFYFEKSKEFKFIPGQYIKIFLPHLNPDSRGTSRYFTISSGIDDTYLRITTKIYKSTFKKKLFNLNIDEKVDIFGPVGFFHFKNDLTPKIFIAGGIGITPFISLLRSEKKINSEIILINSFSYKKDILFKKEIDAMADIRYVITLTKEEVKGFEKVRINAEMIMRNCKNYKLAKFFIVGSVNFERDLYSEILDLGISEENIFKENFTDL